jgi:hypothetical protein
MRPTLVFIRAQYVDGHLRHWPQSEVPPNLLSDQQIDLMLDRGELAEVDASQRRSLYRTFFRFTGATPEQPMTREQLEQFSLPK